MGEITKVLLKFNYSKKYKLLLQNVVLLLLYESIKHFIASTDLLCYSS